ncbi:hypothetical protein K505DRAFT_401370 [Melanomma pulvis-pyrius CBS 109.77]|uniref:Uncharacterized protein n=1 Tax=Melanomma pulvis-pyrius CBS 109.77 TaxID=1314802 RepID=A0A6A6WP47_9PLEO|nr:hypothetical protein K505DRAFT_401370 [Melanomma pulvis-pyrius CBS 109.77]
MFLGLLISFLLCFVSGLLLGVVLLFNNASWLRKNKHKRFWERTVDLLFSICQAGLSIAGIVAITIAFTTDIEPHWLDPVILYTLQLIAGANLTWTIRGIKDSRRAIWLVYGGIVWTAPDIAFYMWCEIFLLLLFLLIAGRDDFFHEYALLSRIAMASIVSWALWNEALQRHRGSGNPIPERVRTLRRFVATNAMAASFQILGAIIQYSLSLANVRTSEIRRGIVLSYMDRLVCSHK